MAFGCATVGKPDVNSDDVEFSLYSYSSIQGMGASTYVFQDGTFLMLSNVFQDYVCQQGRIDENKLNELAAFIESNGFFDARTQDDDDVNIFSCIKQKITNTWLVFRF